MNSKIMLIVVGVLFMVGIVYAVDCWNPAHSISQATCEADSDCMWKSDQWGSWCEQKGCWNFWTDIGCNNATNSINKTCSWRTGSSGWCEKLSCWSYDGTNESACESNANGLTCEWQEQCMGPPEKQCWTYSSSTACTAVAGCNWGGCMEKGCWDYSTQANCSGRTGLTGNDCKWNSLYSYCYEEACWDYTSNSTKCLENNCSWSSNSCMQPTCAGLDYTNQSACESNSMGLNCNWNSPYCEEKGCWNFMSETCNSAPGCTWKTQTGGWCEEVQCWSFDNVSVVNNNGTSTNETYCVNNSAGLSCAYNEGWCYEDIGSKSCGDMLNERNCMDTFYCFWDFMNQSCKSPDNFGGGTTQNVFNAWNPGCYIFDMDTGVCQSTRGCTWNETTSKCDTDLTIISNNELNCSLITNQTVCNQIPMLSTCCKWQAGQCAADTFSNTCWNQMEEPPEGATYCEDYNSYNDQTLCNQIAGSPWFMPCKWDNSTQGCKFKDDNVFQGGEKNIMKLDNQKNCEAAGGKWITESYCDSSGNSTIAVSMGRCEFKFDEERNCNKECFACEFKTDKTNWTSPAEAKQQCIESALGFCGFIDDSTAPNGYGYCDPKGEFKKGLAVGDCNSDCSACTYKGDPTANKAENRPSYHCSNSNANCKWIVDSLYPTDESKGRCGSASEKICSDKCDKCYDESSCSSKGGKKGNESAEVVCEWGNGMCSYKSGASAMEICWDGVDNNGDQKIDCADSMCYSDSFCGGGMMFVNFGKDCFAFEDSDTCAANTCTWVTQPWDSWCDMPGSDCWQHDGNEQECTDTGICEWHSGFGGMCEDDFQTFDACMGSSQELCIGNCTWMVDDWCQNGGGICDPDPLYIGSWYNCVQHDKDGNVTCEDAGTADANGTKPCNWYIDQWCANQGPNAGFCDHRKFSCWMNDDDTSCTNASNSNDQFCQWNTYGEPRCQCNWDVSEDHPIGCTMECNTTGVSEDCDVSKGCEWRADGGCEQKMSGSSGSSGCWSKSAEDCTADPNCRFTSGFCDPPGFGGEMMPGMGGGGMGGGGPAPTGMGGSGMQCFKYDGNQTGCEAMTGCGWFDEKQPFCDVDFSSSCPQYSYNGSLCNLQSKCKYNPQGSDGETGGFCDEKPFECFWNQTLNQNTESCSLRDDICQWSDWNSCQPTCFSQQTAGDCTAVSGCRWVTGWCNPGMAAQFFKGMEGGAPVPLGNDISGDASPASIDIINFGMKDMGKAFGFGITVSSINNAAACNGIKLPSSGSGTGNETTKFYWYLDANGNQSGGCPLKYNSSIVGFDFYIKSVWTYDSSTNKGTSTSSAYRCSSGNWTVAEIAVSTVAQKMCTEIGGGMVAIEKNELEKYSSLYTSGEDIRMMVATANQTGNETNPTDISSSGWLTPGTVDFDLDQFDMFKFESNSSKKAGNEGASKGYIGYDADCWTETGCADYSCKYHPYCVENSYGVEADGFEDTRVPSIIGITKETYPDAAMITYFTDKPSNGTLTLYGNDSTCTAENASIYDLGIINSDLRNFKLWHTAEIYNDGGINSLDYDLENAKEYYYKLKICDESGKCGLSKCSSFRTEQNVQECPFCNFVTRINAPSTWNVSYDIDQDGTYEHLQGNVCGANAGMKTNYTSGRRANIKLVKSDNSTYLEFVNTMLTKTGLNTKVRAISGDGDLSAGTSSGIGYAGMISDTRDKIINNFYPEKCYIKIPGTGTCDTLWHCNDAGDKCLDRTDEAILNVTGSDYCIWQLPYCEFSVWAGGDLSATGGTTTTTSGGGGSSGGGAAPAMKNVEFKEGRYVFEGKTGDSIRYMLAGNSHSVRIENIGDNSVSLLIKSVLIQDTLNLRQSKLYDVDEDGKNDIVVTLESITKDSVNGDSAKITMALVNYKVEPKTEQPVEEITQEEQPVTETPVTEAAGSEPETEEAKESKFTAWVAVPIIAAIAVLLLIIFAAIRHKKH